MSRRSEISREISSSSPTPVLTFLSAAVIGVPIFRLLGQSAVLGYLVAGVVIGGR
jgi:Kef-type K+ transport system membrane component KefB